MKEVIQLRNHHLKQGRNNDRTPVYPITKPEAVLGLDKYLSEAGTGVVPISSTPEEVTPGTIYYNTVEDKYYISNASGALKPIESSGKSAYDIAVDNGFEGTEVEWLASLKGEKGDKGDQGNSGYTGAVGEFEVVNNLEDGGAIKALSAEMGKELNETFNPVKSIIKTVVDDVTYNEVGRYSTYYASVGNEFTGSEYNGSTYKRTKLSVHAGDVITVYGKTDVWCGLYCFCDTNDICVAKTAQSQDVSEENALTYVCPKDGTIYLTALVSQSYGCTWEHKMLVTADAEHDGIMTKEQVSALTVATEETARNKNLNKRMFGTIGQGSDVFAKYIDIPRSCFGDSLYLWWTSSDYTSNNSYWAAAVTNGVETRHDFNATMNRLYDGDDKYYIVKYSLDAFGDCDFIRMSLYNYDDTRINAMFIGSDLDADYLSWDWVKLKKIPPVSSKWYHGESDEINAVVNKVNPLECGAYVSQKNLINPIKLMFKASTTGTPYYPEYTTDYIPVTSNTLYTFSSDVGANSMMKYLYNSNKEQISWTLYDRFTTTSETAYVRIGLSKYNHIEWLEPSFKKQLEVGEKTEYEPYFLFPSELKKSVLGGKRFATIGDSFSAPRQWQEKMCDVLGAIIDKNVAESGGRWSYYANPKCAYLQAQSLATYYNTMQSSQTTLPTKPDYILAVLGVNDVNNYDTVLLGEIVYGDTIGEVGTTVAGEIDPSTFTGGLQACIKVLKDNFPNSIIKVGFTPGGMQYIPPSRFPIMQPYVKRMKEVCDLYGVGYIETRATGMCQIVASELATYRRGANNPHPNLAGQQRIGEYMARIMLSNL